MRRLEPRRPQPRQKVICRGYRCREICDYAQRWCARCWDALSEARRGAIERCLGFLADHQGDPVALVCLSAAIRDADRYLEEVRSW